MRLMYTNLEYVEDKSLATRVYKKLSLRYIIAICFIAVMIISSQIVARKLMEKQLSDSRIINIAGRQRMLSQKLTKELLLFHTESNPLKKNALLETIDSTHSIWKHAHYFLQNGNPSIGLPGNNSEKIKEMFADISPNFLAISESVEKIKSLYKSSSATSLSQLRMYIKTVSENEYSFLLKMDAIVNQFDKEAKERVSSLIRLETTLLLLALLVLFFEVIFIFWPTAKYTKSIITELVESEEMQKQMSEEMLLQKNEEQKFRASLIFEGQERERRRIARDLHDGIGQLLTGLKFQIEAMDGDDAESILFKVGEIKGLSADIIKEIRRVSFDLRPSVLSDYGLTSAIRNITQELNKVTKAEIEFINQHNFDKRLEKKVETHLFRIVQEAINNALKYSKGDKIIVEIAEINNKLQISIKDNGIGFNLEKVRKTDYELQKGHGLFNITERSDFINAELVIKTKPKIGTAIIVSLPLNELLNHGEQLKTV